MPSTTDSEMDKIVKKEPISRNRYTVKTCEKASKKSAGKAPDDFFKFELNQEDLQLLKEEITEMETAIIKSRRNRSFPKKIKTLECANW